MTSRASSRIQATFPACGPPTEHANERCDVSEEPSTPIRVLVIDDSEEIRDVIRLAFDRTTDFEVVAEASSGETGAAAAATHHPGLVLLDIAMPDMDGLQALPLIRSSCPDATVVMLSG